MNKLHLLSVMLGAALSATAQADDTNNRWSALNKLNSDLTWNCTQGNTGESLPCYAIEREDRNLFVRVASSAPAGALSQRSAGDGTGFVRHYFEPEGESIQLSVELDIPSDTYPRGFDCFVSGIHADGTTVPLYSFVTQAGAENSVSLDISTPPNFEQLVVEFTAPDAEVTPSLAEQTPAGTLLTDKDIRVFPNPFRDVLTIGPETEFEAWELFDASGKLIAVGTDHRIPTENATQQGFYLLRIHTADQVLVKRVVRQ